MYLYVYIYISEHSFNLGKEVTLPECFKWIAPGHIICEKTGVEVLTTNDRTPKQQELHLDLKLLAQTFLNQRF